MQPFTICTLLKLCFLHLASAAAVLPPTDVPNTARATASTAENTLTPLEPVVHDIITTSNSKEDFVLCFSYSNFPLAEHIHNAANEIDKIFEDEILIREAEKWDCEEFYNDGLVAVRACGETGASLAYKKAAWALRLVADKCPREEKGRVGGVYSFEEEEVVVFVEAA